MLSKEKLAEMRGLCERATPGPWESTGGDKDTMGYYLVSIDAPKKKCVNGPWCTQREGVPPDAAFIAASRTAIPELLDEVERLTKDSEMWGNEFSAVVFMKEKVQKLEAALAVARDAIKTMDCTCGSEGPDSDHSHVDGGCFQHEALARIGEVMK